MVMSHSHVKSIDHSGQQLQAIIWDFDGTLVDSSYKNYAITQQIFSEIFGYDTRNHHVLCSHDRYISALRNNSNWCTFYRNELQLDERQIEIAGDLWASYQEKDSTEVLFFEGISDILAEYSYVPHGIVSQNARDNIMDTLEKSGLHHQFGVVIGYQDVPYEQQKPDPYGLLRCIQQLIPNMPNASGIILYIGDHQSDIDTANNAHNQLKESGSRLAVFPVRVLFERPMQLLEKEDLIYPIMQTPSLLASWIRRKFHDIA